MITNPIDPKNIELLRAVKAECQMCFAVEYIEVAAISDAHAILHDDGWRTVEIHDTITDPVCPSCIHQMQNEGGKS